MHRSRARARAIFWLLLNTLVWGAVFPLVKPALSLISPFQLLYSRFLLAGVLTAPVIVWYLMRQPKLWRALPRLLILELLGTTFALGLLYSGLELTASVTTTILAATIPVFVTLGGVYFLHEREEKREWTGLALALAGTVLLSVEPILHNGATVIGSVRGNLLILVHNISIAAYYLTAKRWYDGVPKLFVAASSFVVGAISFGALLWLRAGEPGILLSTLFTWQQPAVLIAVIYLAVFTSIVGLTAYIIGQQLIEASEASLFTYLQPLVGVPLGIVLLGERISLLSIAMLLLITAGVGIAQTQMSLNRALRRYKSESRLRSGTRTTRRR